MAREQTPDKGSAGTPPKPDQNGGSEGQDENAPVTRVEYNEILKQVRGQSAAIGKLTNLLEKGGAKKELDPDANKDVTLTSKVMALQQSLAEKSLKASQRSARTAIAEVLVSKGIDAKIANKQAEFLRQQFGERVKVDEDSDMVTVEDCGEDVPASKFMAAYLQLDEAAWLLPAKNPPNDRAAAKGNGGLRMGSSGKLGIPLSAMKSGKYTPAMLEAMKKDNYEILADE
jgi:hypothetical protein